MLNQAAERDLLDVQCHPDLLQVLGERQDELAELRLAVGYGTVAVKPFAYSDCASSAFAFARLKLYFGRVA